MLEIFEIFENHENVENSQNVEEDMTELVTPWFGVMIVPVFLISGFFLFTVPIQIFYPRLILLLKDSYEIILSVFLVLIFYLRNPHLRNYVLRNISSSSSVQPQQSQQIDIELQKI